jgi:hypothetical protein
MSGRDRCEEILRLIDETLEEYDGGNRVEPADRAVAPLTSRG